MRRVTVLLAVVSVAAALTGAWSPVSAVARGVATKTPTTLAFKSQRVAVTTSTHQLLWLSVSGSEYPASAGSISVSLQTHNGREQHQWGFDPAKARLSTT